MREGTTSRVMAADRPYGDFYDVYNVSPECFGYHHVRFSYLQRIFYCLKYVLVRN
jgi:hypothetical protein